MSELHPTPYGTYASLYRDLGFWPRPLRFPGIDPDTRKPLGKACKEKFWTLPDPELPQGTIERWDKKYAHCNIGLLMGSPLPDGTFLGVLDIDHDEFVPLSTALLGKPVSGRIGQSGVALFVRHPGRLPNSKFDIKGDLGKKYGHVLECLFTKTQCVIPPSTHPGTGKSYRWIGTPLHELTDFTQLPFIGE